MHYCVLADSNNNETRFLILNAGWWSMAVLNGNSLENVTYDIAISYGNLEAVTDTITLMDLLNNAPLVEQVENNSVYLGYKPSSFVEDIAGKMRYAIAYKLQLDSAESVVVTRTPSFDDQLFIYRSKGDSVELIDKVDGEEPYLLTADSMCAYYVVFSSWSSEEMGFVDEISVQPFVANSYSLAEVIGMAKDITLPYHEEGTLGDVLCSDLNTYVKCYRVKLDSAAVLRFIVENVSLLYDAWPAMYIYAQDTTLVFDDSRSLLDMNYMADSTAYYYLVVTTDYEFSPGGFVFDAQLTESRTIEQQLTDATLLEGKGTRTDNLYYMPEVNAMCRFYKMELDSSQMVYFEPLSGNLTVFKAVGDTIEDVPLYNDYFFAADSTTTYYVGIVTNSQNSIQFTYAITPKALPIHDVEGMHFMLSDALNFEQSAFIWNSAPFLSTDKYRFSLSKDEHALLLQNDGDHANLSYVLLNGTPIGSNFTTPYQSPKDSVYEVQVITPMGNNNVPFNMLLQRAEAHDSVLNRAPSIEMEQFPYSASETRKQNFEQKRLVYYQNKMYNCYAAFKVDMKLGDQLRFEVPVGSGAIAADYVVFKQGTSGYSRVANSQFADIYSRTFSAPATATYYIMIKASEEVGKGVFDKMDDVLAFTVSNPNAVTEVVRIEADRKMVQSTDYTSDISVRMALAEVQLTAITKNGASVGITNSSSGWTVNSDVTMATYSATLPTGYAFTADAKTEVTVWVNPGVVNVTVGEHGSVTPTDTVVLRGESVTLNVKAHTGFVVHTVKVNDADYAVNFIGKSGGSFTLLADDVLNVEVMFRAISALDKVETPQAAVYARDSRLVIEGADKGSTIQVYTLMGTLIHTTQATSSVHEFELPTAGLYIVRVGTQVTKVMCR